jgi:hypothetical protein
MKLLLAATFWRPDLLFAIAFLASKVSMWNKSHDGSLMALMQYVASKPHLHRQKQSFTDNMDYVILVLSTDADFAGDFESAKFTTGMFFGFQSKDGPLHWILGTMIESWTPLSQSSWS